MRRGNVMTSCWGRVIMVVAAFCATATAHGATPEEIAKLVAQLGSPEYAVRDAAERELVSLGAAARPALREGAGSKDPEIQVRATRALELVRIACARSDTLWNETLSNGSWNNGVMSAKIGDQEIVFYISSRIEIVGMLMPPLREIAGERPRKSWVGPRDLAPQFMALADAGLLVTTTDARFVCLDPKTGTVRWDLNTTVGLDGSLNPPGAARSGRGPASTVPGLSAPAIDGGMAYLSTDHSLLAVDIGTGKAVWQAPLTAGLIGMPLVLKESVLVASTGGLMVFDKKSSKRLDVLGPELAIYSAPVALNDHVIVLGTLDGLVALDVSDGHKLWTHEASGMSSQTETGARVTVPRPTGGHTSVGMAPPALDHGTVYYSGIDTLFAVDAVSGKERWKWQPTPMPGAPVVNAPALAAAASISPVAMRNVPRISAPVFAHDGQWVLVNTLLGAYAIESSNGQMVWEYHVPNALPPVAAPNGSLAPPVVASDMVHLMMSQREVRAPAGPGGRGTAAGGVPAAAVAIGGQVPAAANVAVVVNRYVALPLDPPNAPSAPARP